MAKNTSESDETDKYRADDCTEPADQFEKGTPGDLNGTEDAVRIYRAAPGEFVCAWREDDQHVVRLMGTEPGQDWTRAYPAQRTHVFPGEKMWTIPDNWEHQLTIRGADSRAWDLYHIPKSGVDVKILKTDNVHPADAWVQVKTVGELKVEWVGSWHWENTKAAVETAREIHGAHSPVVDSIEQLKKLSYRVEQEYDAAVTPHAKEGLFDCLGPGRMMDGWTFDNWRVGWTESLEEVLLEVLDGTRETRKAVQEILIKEDVVSVYPEVRPSIISEGLPDDYRIRSLIQAGCSPSEAVDYLIARSDSPHDVTQAEWADERRVSQPTVSDNIRAAEATLEK
ncbi:hypothetical protein RYH80_18575 [Halobaculum sp. MBLA0147]|uniref:hypothetical protein n=1 Tax=Halobaculum sp. MBLA0147 TaxID=3079934 RepID=UPI0035260B66